VGAARAASIASGLYPGVSMIKAFAAAAGAIALALSAMAANAEPPPLSAYGALPAIEKVAISDSGANLAFITVVGEQRRLVMQTMDGQPLGIIGIGNTKVRDVTWAGDEHLIIMTTTTASLPQYGVSKHEWLIAQSYSLKKKRIINLAAQTDWTFINGSPVLRQMDGKWYAFIENYSSTRPILLLQRVSLDDGRTNIIDSMPWDDAQGWLVDADGQPAARSRYNTVRGYWSLGLKQGAIWPDIYQVDAKLDPPTIAGFGRDGRSILIQESVEDGNAYVEIGRDGRAKPALPDDHTYNHVIFDRGGKQLIGASYFDHVDRYVFFDPADQTAWSAVQKAFKGQEVGLVDWSADRKRVVVYVLGARSSGIFYLIDMTAKRADIIGEAYPGVTAEYVGLLKPYSYKAADGVTVPGYLVLPAGREAKNLPLVVMPHGGPEAHDGVSFDYWAQAIASRGYAVLQPNFRGSTGYGLDWVEAGYGQWGRKMQTDLSDGVKALASEGVIDPSRVCIVGASYGGYAAMAGVTIQKDVYRCAVAVAGISDLRVMLKDEAKDAGKKSLTTRYWRRFMGVENDSDPALETISPLQNAAAASAPILLIHGRDDTVVPFHQSSRLADALRKAGKPVELVTLPGEDHWLSRGATRLQMLETTVNFLLKENPPQ
jgi:dipeptidyl aminopeptidase/acylaminoacyl peptidase